MLTAFGGALASMEPGNVYQSVTLASFAALGLGGVIVPAATVAMGFPGCSYYDLSGAVAFCACCGWCDWV